MKVFFRRIHLYLSLAAGLVILVCCLTGAILVFQKELEQLFNKERYYVAASGNRLSLDSVAANVKKKYPDVKINGMKVYTAAERTIEVNVSRAEKKEKGQQHGPAPKADGKPKTENRGEARAPTLTAFVNPYTGAVIALNNPREGFFYTTLALHRWLLGSNSGIGKYITGISTLLFLFILITGIILWWPKTKRILAQRLKVKWDGGWKRLNHDLHIVFGFYSAIFLFIFAFTALAWSFEWFNKGIYKVTSSSMKPPEQPKSIYSDSLKKINYDAALLSAQEHVVDVEFLNITMPKDSVGAVTVASLSKQAPHETATDALYLDQYTGKMLGSYLFAERNLGARVRATFRPVHVGSIWGTPSKIIALIVCLLGVTFPITGYIMWINRTRKKSKKAPREVNVEDAVS